MVIAQQKEKDNWDMVLESIFVELSKSAGYYNSDPAEEVVGRRIMTVAAFKPKPQWSPLDRPQPPQPQPQPPLLLSIRRCVEPRANSVATRHVEHIYTRREMCLITNARNAIGAAPLSSQIAVQDVRICSRKQVTTRKPSKSWQKGNARICRQDAAAHHLTKRQAAVKQVIAPQVVKKVLPVDALRSPDV
jgi:hypothetical protein